MARQIDLSLIANLFEVLSDVANRRIGNEYDSEDGDVEVLFELTEEEYFVLDSLGDRLVDSMTLEENMRWQYLIGKIYREMYGVI